MSSHNLFRPSPVEAEVYANIPALLVFDIEPELLVFFEETCNMARSEYDIDLVISEALLHISDLNYLEDGLTALRHQLLLCHSQENGYAPHDGEALADSTVKLARCMHAKFLALGAYLADGTLPFQFSKFINNYSYTPTPVLEKCLDYLP